MRLPNRIVLALAIVFQCLQVAISSLEAIQHCEYDALRLGTDIADVFNSPIGGQDWVERISQNSIAESLGFAPWMVQGIQNSGLTLTKASAKELQMKGGWVGRAIADSPYGILNHKWIYMLGDSTTRQIWASFAAPFQGNDFKRNSKEWTRQYVSSATSQQLVASGLLAVSVACASVCRLISFPKLTFAFACFLVQQARASAASRQGRPLSS